MSTRTSALMALVVHPAMSAFDPGCVKTHTSAKCRKYNSPTRLRAARGQYDLTPAMRNLAEVLLRACRAREFSHGQDPSGHVSPLQNSYLKRYDAVSEPLGAGMRRRDFIKLIGGAAACPVTALAQQAVRTARIGYLSPASEPDPNIEIFRHGMSALGYVEGRDYVLQARYAQRNYARLPALVQELLAEKVELIVTGGASSRGASFAAQSVPVVFGFSGDPVDAGIVASFARPGGNATGVSFLALDLAAKRAELIKEVAPTIKRVAVLSNPEHPGEVSELRVTREAADKLGIGTQYFPADSDAAIPAAFAAIADSQCDALLTFPDALTLFHRQRIAAFALSRRLPSIFGWKAYTDGGGRSATARSCVIPMRASPISWTESQRNEARGPSGRAAHHPRTRRQPQDRQGARATVPPTLLARADEVIE